MPLEMVKFERAIRRAKRKLALYSSRTLCLVDSIETDMGFLLYVLQRTKARRLREETVPRKESLSQYRSNAKKNICEGWAKAAMRIKVNGIRESSGMLLTRNL